MLVLPLAGSLSAPAAVTDNLVAYWTFEGSATNSTPASGGSAYDGVLSGNAVVTGTPKVGTGALLLDGTGDYLDVASTVDVNQPWSVSAWFRSVVAPTGRGMIFESSGSYAISYGIREGTPATHTNFQAYTDLATGTDPFVDSQVPDASTAETWHHILLTFTPATPIDAGTVIGYLDGTAIYTLNVPAGTTLTPANGFHIGTYRSANDRWFTGSIDEVAMWNRTLSIAEASEVFSRGNQGESLVTTKLNIALSANPATQGSVTGNGVYNPGQEVPITATPNPGYIFLSWSGDFTGQPTSFTYTANAGATAVASFGEDTSDSDGDGLSNYEEIVIHLTNPNNPDTDGDRIPDGAEANITFTSPTASDAALVSFVDQNLCTNEHAGAIALNAPRIERNPASGVVSLFLGLSGSPDQGAWQPVNLNSPSVTITPVTDGWDITIPAPSNTVNSYVLLGRKP
ncbi:LamG domain-containing protein [Luteolibacter luteus]|uniref:LamG domain-containing protein n=1 Tax=Luteolibacter luteus TaxID=2728835 RepID=A0A858REK3_9BACT|nr:LamG domain-containing protein [Luteolibacter luteus]QJE95257.1 LamG domain-containing protein [Luteolibacter luteus]